jgi:Nucleotidyl transferase AbiEii toxin, Type IV TA system
VLAEKITTAITLGAASTRVRDYADIYTLTSRHDIDHSMMREALRATARFRGTSLQTLSTAVDDLVPLRRNTYTAYRRSLGPDGERLPADFDAVVTAVTAFADPIVEPAPHPATWHASGRQWRAQPGATTPVGAIHEDGT